MNIIQHIVLSSLILGCAGNKILAQTDNKLSSLALVKKDSVVLRWVPSSVSVWQTGIKYGYIIKRYTIAKGGVFIPDGLNKGKLLASSPVKPAGREAFEILSKSEPKAVVVQEAIYGSEFQSQSADNNFNKFMKEFSNLEVRFGFALFMCDLSSQIAGAAGLRFVDRSVVSDERYAYSISLSNIPDGMEVEPSVVVLDAGLITRLPQISEIQAVFLDRKVNFRWPLMLYQGTYTAYILEKSRDGINYTPVSDLPLVNLTEEENLNYFVYTDSLGSNNELIWYRVKGISPFGETGPASEIIKGEGSPDFSVYSVIDSAEVIGNKKIVIRWRTTENKSAPVTGIRVQRSDKPEGVFEDLTPKPLIPDKRMFTDYHPMLTNYYKVLLIGKNNLTSSSFPYLVQIEDKDFPAAPQMLSGKVDSSGVVTIAWEKNIESDLLGYKVFRANTPEEDFIPLNHNISLQNVCFDTINLKTTTQKIYYQVVAVDKRYNSSEFSSVLELSRPDTIRPSPAVITRIDATDGKVFIQMEGSPSSDIKSYKLYRSSEYDSIPLLLATWEGNLPGTFNDVLHEHGEYYYLLKTFDFKDNISEFGRSIYVPVVYQNTVNLKAEQSRNGKRVLLTWDLPEGFQPLKTIVYRGKDKEPISTYLVLEGEVHVAEDIDIELNTRYNYRIKVSCKSGNSIVTSPQLTLKTISESQNLK